MIVFIIHVQQLLYLFNIFYYHYYLNEHTNEMVNSFQSTELVCVAKSNTSHRVAML